MYQEFVVPDEDEFVRELGIELRTELVNGESSDETVRYLVIDLAADDQFVFSFDVPGRSVRLRRLTGGVSVMDIFREGATRLSIACRGETRCLTIDFETESSRGRLEVTAGVRVELVDHMLLT